jgi:hypothetical protein
MVSHGVPFATPRTRRASQVIEWFSCFPAVQLCHAFRRGVRRGRCSSLSLLAGANARYRSRSPFILAFRISAFQHFPLGFTEPALVLRSPQKPAHSAPSTGTVPPAPVTDSPALQPLHSIAFRLQRFHLHSTAFRRPQTGETVKSHRARPKEQGHQRPRDYVRPDPH